MRTFECNSVLDSICCFIRRSRCGVVYYLTMYFVYHTLYNDTRLFLTSRLQAEPRISDNQIIVAFIVLFHKSLPAETKAGPQ